MSSKRIFRPKLSVTFSFLILFALLIALGFWQLDRASQKQELFDEYSYKSNLPELDFSTVDSSADINELIWRKARVVGEFSQSRHILLDNQVSNGRPGYLLYTPLILPSRNEQILVNRGWIAAGPYRDIIPEVETPEGIVSLKGSLKRPPEPGVLLSPQIIDRMSGGFLRAQALSIGHLESALDQKLSSIIIRLDEGSDIAFDLDWGEPGFGKERHTGYAFQWFALAATLLVLYIFLNFTRAKDQNG